MATDDSDLWSTPAAPAPDGHAADFSSKLSEARLFYGVTSVAMVIATFCVLLKLYIRMFIHKQPGWDDLCLALALGIHLGFTIINDVVFAQGGARHQYDMSIGEFLWVIKTQNDALIIQMLAYLFTKLALLLLYYRLFKAKAAFKWAILAGCSVVAVAYLAFMFIYIFATEEYVVTLRSSYGMGWFDLITDVYLWLLPLFAVGSLKLQWHRKVGVAGLFSFGALACAMSAVSLTYRLNVGNLTDWTWEYPRCNTVIAVEIYVGIITACVPVFPSLWRDSDWSSSVSKVFRRIAGRTGSTTRTGTEPPSASGKGKGLGTSTASSRVSGMFPGNRNQTQDRYAWASAELEGHAVQKGVGNGEPDWPLVEYRGPSAQGTGPDDVSTAGLSIDSLYEPSSCSVGDGDEHHRNTAEYWRQTRENAEVSPV